MPDVLLVFLLCLVLGSGVGIIAGLLGIGGGLVIVPSLAFILPYMGVDDSVLMPIALGTSMGSIVLTSTSSMLAHHKHGNVPWDTVRIIVIAVALGALGGAGLADHLDSLTLKRIFSAAVIILGLYMTFSSKAENHKPLPGIFVLFPLCVGVGVLASLMGISGGLVMIPLLSFLGMQLRHAIGAGAALGVAASLMGTIGYVSLGWGSADLPQWSLGYIYLPALLGLTSTSMFTAPVGARWAKQMPVEKLRKIFALFLTCIAVYMLISA